MVRLEYEVHSTRGIGDSTRITFFLKGGAAIGESKHDEIAKRLAEKEGTTYNEGQGPDVQTSKRVIEVATHEGDLQDSMRQLQGFGKPRYLATTSQLLDKAKEITKGTKVGVMGPTGHIAKRAGGGGRGR